MEFRISDTFTDSLMHLADVALLPWAEQTGKVFEA